MNDNAHSVPETNPGGRSDRDPNIIPMTTISVLGQMRVTDAGGADVLPRGRKPAALPASGPDAAGKRILEAERQRVIDHYRQLKLAKMLGSHKPAS